MRKYLNVEHYLNIYKIRLKMMEDGVTNPTFEGRQIIQTVVEKLSKLPLSEKIVLEDGKMKDSKGNVIVIYKNK